MRLALLCLLMGVICSSTVYGMEREKVLEEVKRWLGSQPTQEELELVSQGTQCMEAVNGVSAGRSRRNSFLLTDVSDVPCLQRLYESWTSSVPEQRNGEIVQKKKRRKKKGSRKDPATLVMQNGRKGKQKSLRQLAREKRCEDDRLLDETCRANRQSEAMERRLMGEVPYAENVLRGLMDKHRSKVTPSTTALFHVQELHEGVPVYVVYDDMAWYLFSDKHDTPDPDIRGVLDCLQQTARRKRSIFFLPVVVKKRTMYMFAGPRKKDCFSFFNFMAAVSPEGDGLTRVARQFEKDTLAMQLKSEESFRAYQATGVRVPRQ